MACCTPSREGSGEAPQAAVSPGAPASSTGRSEAARVRFAAARSFVGTDRPVLHADGEGPALAVTLRAFDIEAAPVTNARFADFVAATGHVTEAERFGWSTVFVGLLPEGARAAPSQGPTPWWAKVEGACWRAPEGPGSTIAARHDHPVVQVSWRDAVAFAGWAGGRLPGEAEWEHAARGGLADPRFPWGDAEPDDATIFCNIWQGAFPLRNTCADGFYGTCPVDAFAKNGAGLYGMCGNVWEWCADDFAIRTDSRRARARNAAALAAGEKLLKGGSFLCHRSYCYRYRIAARSAMSAGSATNHVGFRLAFDT